MPEIELDEIAFSDLCRTKCIDKKKVYCPTQDHSSGYCCDGFIGCEKAEICSNNVSAGNKLKYWSCPNEAYCNNPFISANKNGEIETYTMDFKTSNLVVNK